MKVRCRFADDKPVLSLYENIKNKMLDVYN